MPSFIARKVKEAYEKKKNGPVWWVLFNKLGYGVGHSPTEGYSCMDCFASEKDAQAHIAKHNCQSRFDVITLQEACSRYPLNKPVTEEKDIILASVKHRGLPRFLADKLIKASGAK